MGIMISISQASVLVNLPFDIADEGTCQVFSSFLSVLCILAWIKQGEEIFFPRPHVFLLHILNQSPGTV